MATTPPTPNQPQKPTGTPPAAGQKPPVAPGQKPAVPPGQKPANPAGQKPVAPGQKPPVAGQKPTAPQAPKPAPPPVKKPAPPKNKFLHVDATTRQLGQKLVDLGYLDDGQLESIYEEMRTSDSKMAEIAIERRLVTDDQLLAATAELHGMKVDTLEDKKPTKEAIKVVPQNMAELYKMVPLDFENDTLTVAMSDPNNLQALDDIRNFLGIRQVNAVLAPAAAVMALMQKAYQGGPAEEESIANIIAQLESDPDFVW